MRPTNLLLLLAGATLAPAFAATNAEKAKATAAAMKAGGGAAGSATAGAKVVASPPAGPAEDFR
ncbi:MAG: hypothetical protein RL250_1302, partial [Verrucomicrobiota bacterium]